MREFFENLISTWWGIAIIVVVALAIWILLSAIFYRQFFKRFYDIVLSFIALCVLSPIFIFLMILGAIKMKGNPLFRQLRPGKKDKKTGQEKIFKMLKFRTMTCQKDANGNLLPDEKRLTKYGRFLRKTSLDELPELINIFLGKMSIVGPRPLLVRDMVFMTEEQRKRHDVTPGLTGLAQVSGRNNIKWEEKLEFDVKYTKNISLWADIKIIFQTAMIVLKRKDVERAGTVSDVDFGDWLKDKKEVSADEYDEKQEQARKIINDK